MAVLKLSQITAAGSPPATSDQLVGVTAGATDNLFSVNQVRRTVLVSNSVFSVKDYGALGDGTTNDYAAFAAALTAIYANKGGIFYVPYSTAGYVLGTSVVIDVGSYAGGGGICVDLGGNTFLPSHTGWCFDVAANYFGANNALVLGKKPVLIRGNGATINTSNSSAAGGIRFTDCVGCELANVTVKPYSSGVAVELNISTTDQSTWCEHNTIRHIRGHGNLIGLYFKSGATASSFLGSTVIDTVFEGTVNNTKLYNFEGTLFDCVFTKCGGYYNQSSATGGNGFYLNGGFQNCIFIDPWIDSGGGGTQSAATDIVFGPSYSAALSYFPIIVGAFAIQLPLTWRTQLHIVGPVNPSGLAGSNAFANPREVLRSPRIYYVNGSTGSDTANNGLSSGAAFATVAHAQDVILKTIDCGGFNITIQLADATYTTQIVVSGNPIGLGNASFILQGTTTTTAVISTTSQDALVINGGARVQLNNLTLQTTTSGNGLFVDQLSTCLIGSGCKFGACATRGALVFGGSSLYQNGATTWAGATPLGVAIAGGSRYFVNAATVNSGINFTSTFMDVSEASVVEVDNTSYTHVGTLGSSFYAHAGGMIQTFGQANTLFTGVAGFADATQYSQYL